MRVEFRDVRLDELMEQRETLEARIRRIAADTAAKPGSLQEAQAELADVNEQIHHHRPRNV